jgi:hypothetical protein
MRGEVVECVSSACNVEMFCAILLHTCSFRLFPEMSSGKRGVYLMGSSQPRI